jgi:hypothetical protein
VTAGGWKFPTPANQIASMKDTIWFLVPTGIIRLLAMMKFPTDGGKPFKNCIEAAF